LITISGFEEDTGDSKNAPALIHLEGAATFQVMEIPLADLLLSKPM